MVLTLMNYRRKKMTSKRARIEGLGVVDLICNRKKKGLYTLIFVAGLPGTGKSSSCIRLAELISKRLTGENQITEDNIFDDFLGLVGFIRKAKPEEVNIGVIEEASVLFPSRRAMSGENVDINRVLDTARKKQVILLANAPLWNSIDTHMRALGNIYIETLSIDQKNSFVICKPLGLQTNPKSGKTYYHYMSVKGREIHRVLIGKPNKETWERYEKRKDAFMDKVYQKAIHRNKKKMDKEEKEIGIYFNKKENQPFTARELEMYDLIYKKDWTQKQVAARFGISRPRISQILNNMRKKTG